jgi:type IV secretion system protein TrbF
MMALFRRKRKNPAADPTKNGEGTGSPYTDAQNVWLERYGHFVSSASNWRLIAILEAIVLVIAVIGLIYTANQTKFVPYVVEVDKIGQALPVAPADRAAPVDQRVLHAQLARWITTARSVVRDSIVEQDYINLTYGLIAAQSEAKGFLDDYYRSNNPYIRARAETVEVNVTSILPVSSQTYEVRWTETHRDQQGHQLKQTNWEASIGIAIVPPSDEATIMNNPLGIYITTLNWTPLAPQ